MIHPPAPLSGNHPLASWLNKLREFCIHTAPQGIVGGRMRQDSRGTFIEVAPGGGGSDAVRLILKSVQDEYLTCHTWDGTNEGAEDIYVAKPWTLRCVAETVSIFGQDHTFSFDTGPDSDNKYRTHAYSTTEEQEMVLPPWIPDHDEISAIPADTGVETVPADPETEDPQPVKYLMLEDGRMWGWTGL